jgi:hypothetical protein
MKILNNVQVGDWVKLDLRPKKCINHGVHLCCWCDEITFLNNKFYEITEISILSISCPISFIKIDMDNNLSNKFKFSITHITDVIQKGRIINDNNNPSNNLNTCNSYTT